MSMSKRRSERQQHLWINTTEIVTSPGHPFYQRLGNRHVKGTHVGKKKSASKMDPPQ